VPQPGQLFRYTQHPSHSGPPPIDCQVNFRRRIVTLYPIPKSHCPSHLPNACKAWTVAGPTPAKEILGAPCCYTTSPGAATTRMCLLVWYVVEAASSRSLFTSILLIMQSAGLCKQGACPRQPFLPLIMIIISVKDVSCVLWMLPCLPTCKHALHGTD